MPQNFCTIVVPVIMVTGTHSVIIAARLQESCKPSVSMATRTTNPMKVHLFYVTVKTVRKTNESAKAMTCD